ncbi:telomerase reverse transcriptase [Neopsephotus bourkii]|uniref:telomerase reverse transcriptase n=1 Tax=Neopsephotus bourkii TaxID=309878 RepID=UPI002AA56CF3|nr:telomerase reverse transcriptase [Neopsephotus bourkii]
MAGMESYAAVLTALRGCYAEVAPLETFIRQLQDSSSGEAEVLRDNDIGCYRTFVGACLVCVPRGARAIPRPFTFEQLSSQKEVTARVVQRLCEKRKKNVFAYGYALLDENSSHVPVMPCSRIYRYLSNTGTETTCTNGVWETLLSRIGDDVMMYLMEHCAIFMLVPPSNCYQVCGQPIYELIPRNVHSLSAFVRQRFSKHKHSRLLDYVQKRLMFHRQYLSKSHWWKSRQRLDTNVSSMGSKKNNNIRSSMPSYQCSAEAVSEASRQIRMATEHLEAQSSSNLCLSATVPSLKRKLNRTQCEIPAKRARVEEKACNLTPAVNQTSSERCRTGCVASHSASLKKRHISQRSNSDMSGPSLVHTSHARKVLVPRASSCSQGVQSNELLKSSTEMQAESHTKAVEMCMHESQSDSVQTKPVDGISSKCRRQKSPVGHLVKQLPNKFLHSAVYISRKLMLYCCRSLRECFPKSFLLNQLQGCQAGGRRLIETIFLNSNLLQKKHNRNLLHHNWRKKRLPKRYWQMRHIFGKLLENHGKCPYLAILKKHCPVKISEASVRKSELPCGVGLPGEAEAHKQAKQFVKEPAKGVTSSRCESGHTNVPDNLHTSLSNSVHGKSQSEEQNPGDVCESDLRNLISQRNTYWEVYMFVRECLEQVIPAELWGSNHNKCQFLKNVKIFISMGKFAKLSLKELMWKMRVNDCMWLRLVKGDHFVPAYEHCFREELLAKFLYWLMDTYVIELLRSFFYVTETSFRKNLLSYYRKFVWSKLQSIGIRSHFAEVRLRALSSKDIEAIRQKKYVTSRLRFIPRENGLRPIVSVSSVVNARAFSKESREKKVQQYNTELKNLFSVLNYERAKNRSSIGSSVFGKDDIYRTWKNFVTEGFKSYDEIPPFYFVKADVSKAYDTIPHNKLVEVVSRILKPQKKTPYCIRRYAVIMITASGKARKSYKRSVSTWQDFEPDMEKFVSYLQKTTSLQNAIVVEQSLSSGATSSSLFAFFLQVIHNNILEIRNRYYVQCCGIPQGSILSTLLCSLCYGDMENKLLSGIQQDGVLMRLIDDFLLITPHLMKARHFLRTLATGIPEYGFLINPSKTVVNFCVDDIPGCSEFKQVPDHSKVPWCGLLLDIQKFDIYCDYSRYSYTSIRSSLSFNTSRTAGKNMKYKLTAVLKLKCHSLFLDLQINSLRAVLINIYQIFLLQAYRFHACVLQLPFNQQVRKNPYFFLRIISETASCCYSMLKAKNKGIALGKKGASGMFPSEAAEWLCYVAFTTKLAQHKVIYACLLKPLKICKMQLFRQIPKNTMALLKEVTAPAFYQDFKSVRD